MNFKNIFLVISTIIIIGMTGCGNDTNSNATTNRASAAGDLIGYTPDSLPTGVTITTPTLTATLVSTKNTTYGVDVDGNIPLSGLLVKVPYHANRDVTLDDFTSSPFTINASNTKSGTAVDVVFQWRNIHLSAGDGYFDAKIVPLSSAYHAKQLDLHASGYRAATFLYPKDDSSSVGELDLKVMAGILDRNFNVKTNGKYEHRFIYMPVTNTITGRTWLNNNLGAEYADANNPNGNFNPMQQATSATDYRAYGSQFQWGRKADGHELISWTGVKTGAGKYGDTTTRADNPSNSLFIWKQNNWRVHPDETLWASESSPNNVCPAGYRLPLTPNGATDSDNEFYEETNSWDSQDAAGSLSSKLKLSMAGFRYNSYDPYYPVTYGLYWSGNYSSDPYNSRNMRLEIDKVFLPDTTLRTVAMSVRCIKD